MLDQTKEKIKKLNQAYFEFEKRLNELKKQEDEFVNKIIDELEQKEIKSLLEQIEKIEQIKD